MEEEMEEVLIRLEKERKQSEKNYSVPEISGYTAAQEEFTGGRFLVTSFYMPEIKDEVQRRERIFKLYHILSAHTEKMCIRDRLAAYAGQNSPYYGRLYKGLPEDWKLTDLPTVNKVDLMAHFDMWLTDRTVTEEAVNSFMEDRENIGRLMDGKYLIFTTSGSTGSPLVVLYDKTCMNISSALSVLRAYARREDLSAFIKKGKRTASIFAEGFYLGSGSVKYQLRRMPWKKGMMMNLDVRTPTAEIVEKLNRFSPVMLGGYPSGLELLADEQAAGRLHISPAIVMTGGELLRDEVREKLADAFGGYVQTNYSCTEGGTMCHECVNRHLHINDEWIMIEAVDEDNRPVPDGTQSAKILLTNLANKAARW